MAASKVTAPDGFVRIGKVTKAQGIRGEVRIFSLSAQPENFLAYKTLALQANESSGVQEFSVVKVRLKGNFAIVALAGITDRNQAEELVGSQVWLAEDELTPLGEDEFYWHEVMGAEVVDQDGNSLGILTALLAGGGGDLMVVRQGEDELLIPSRPEFLQEVGPERIVVDLPPGLLDINRKDDTSF